MNKNILISIPFMLISGCASLFSLSSQYPAPHNDYTGIVIQEHFSEEDPTDFMIRSCKMYGGFNQDSVKNIGKDHLMQYIMQFRCNYNGKLSNELNIDGKSSVRLNGSIATIKCQNLGFEVGTINFRKCMEELTR